MSELTSKDLSTDELHRQCPCGLAQDVGFLLICDEFADDDTGDCLTCGHAKACHEHKGLEEWRSIFDKGAILP